MGVKGVGEGREGEAGSEIESSIVSRCLGLAGRDMKVCDDVRDKMICKGTNGERAIKLCTQSIRSCVTGLLFSTWAPSLDTGSHSMWQQPLHLIQDEYE